MPTTSDRATRNAVQVALGAAERRLRAAGVPSPAFDARLLLRHATGWTAADLAAFGGGTLPEEAERAFERGRSRFEALIRDRAARRPLQHLVGRVSFFGLDLAVGPEALIPRPETEILVEAAFRWAEARSPGPLVIADVGCGSGAIALALASRIATARVLALDCSTSALELTVRNAAATGLASRVHPVRADLLRPVGPRSLDLVTANLPYIPSAEISTLEPEVRDHEPRLALDGGPDGLALLRRLAPMAARTLRSGGRLFVEIGADQEPAVRAALTAAGFAPVETHLDLAGIPRVLSAAASHERTFACQ